MKKGFSVLIIIGIIVAIAVGAVYFLSSNKSELPPNEVACTLEAKICPDGTAVGRTGPNCEFAPCPSASPLPESFDASFEIYTNGTKRIFSAAMYHNQSEDAYIEISDPSIVHVNTAGTTWGEFFNTLPFSLDEQCLTTGTGQTFCTGQDGTLEFILNGDEAPNALSVAIEPEDSLVIKYD